MERLREICLDAYDHLIGLELSEVAVDCCVTKAQKAEGRRPEEARWTGANGAQALDGGGRFGHPAWRRECPGQSSHDSPLLVPTLGAASEALGALPEGASVHLDRGYDSHLTRERLAELGLRWEISGKGKPAPFWATNRWVVERTSSWQAKLAHKKLL